MVPQGIGISLRNNRMADWHHRICCGEVVLPGLLTEVETESLPALGLIQPIGLVLRREIPMAWGTTTDS